MTGNYNQLYKNTSRHLRKTKDKMIQPFDREVGKSGKPLNQGKQLTEEKRQEIIKRIEKQNIKERDMQRLKIFGIFGLMLLVYFFFMFRNQLFYN